MTCKYCGDTGYFRLQQTADNSPCPCVFCTELGAPKELESINGVWIACSERLPESGQNIITLNNCGGCLGGMYLRNTRMGVMFL